MKRKIIITVVVALVLILVGLLVACKEFLGFIFTSGFDISIYNQTNTKISGLKITYKNVTKDVEIPDVEANSKVKLNVNPSENFGENSMMLYYLDKGNKRHEETIIGYFERGYSGKVNIEINSINESGRLEIKVKETS